MQAKLAVTVEQAIMCAYEEIIMNEDEINAPTCGDFMIIMRDSKSIKELVTSDLGDIGGGETQEERELEAFAYGMSVGLMLGRITCQPPAPDIPARYAALRAEIDAATAARKAAKEPSPAA